MTQSQRNKYITEWKRTLNAIEKRYIGSVRRALQGQINQTVEALKVGGIEYARRRLSSLQFDAPMAEAIQKMHRSVGLMMARRTYNSLEASPVVQKATLGQAAQWLQDIIEYFRVYLLDSVDTINNTTRDWIRRKLDQGFTQGYSVDEIVREINNREYLGHRAEVIVRTESVRAANYGVQKGAETYEFKTVKEWVSVRDDRTRHSHRLVDRQTAELDSSFSNGLKFPGDPEGSAKEVVNCRCAMVINPLRDKDGRLIPKQRLIAQQ